MTDSSEDGWFSGPVKDAVNLVSERDCVFLVYIHDDSEKSNTLTSTLRDEKVIETIKTHTVALSMQKDSENATLFGQFYPTQTVPILYFIKQGTIKDFGTETITGREIIDKIATIIEVSTPIIEQQVAAANEDAISLPATSSTAVNASTADKEAKKQQLQKQLDQIRKQKSERELQAAKDREIKRREEAKSMQEAKQSKVDKENKIYFEKIKKERLEDEAHRKKVRQQIATDRAEKIAQRNAEKQRKSSSSFDSSEIIGVNANKTTKDHDCSYLNIRQLDGTNVRHRFEAPTTLSEVRHWIAENRTDDKKKQYKLSSQFPTRLFTQADDEATLSDLNLCPSATLIMKPLKSASSSSSLIPGNNAGGIVGYAIRSFDYVYGFLIALFNILVGIFSSIFPRSGPSPHALDAQAQQPILRNMRGGQRLGGEPLVDSSTQNTSTANTEESSTRKRNPYATRVNTLQDDNADDEKRPTYNGNSVNHE